MIDAKDIRIGNLIWVNSYDELPDWDKSYHPSGNEVVKVDLDIITDIASGLGESYAPIQITGDWLKQFENRSMARGYGGAEIINDWKHIAISSDYDVTAISWYDNKVYLRDCDEGKIGRQINFVHELQNLYFCLTGEELAIKL